MHLAMASLVNASSESSSSQFSTAPALVLIVLKGCLMRQQERLKSSYLL